MPRFDFQCNECGFEFEMSLSHGLTPKHCPMCAAAPDQIVKLPSAFSTTKLSSHKADEKVLESSAAVNKAGKKKSTQEHQCGPQCEIHSKAASLVEKHLK